MHSISPRRVRKAALVAAPLLALVIAASPARALPFVEVAPAFAPLSGALLDAVAACDDCSLQGDLAAPVSLGGATFEGFSMDSNGSVELLRAGDAPLGFGFGSVLDLVSADPSRSYLLMGYDDLSSERFGYFGYRRSGNATTFFWETESFLDYAAGVLKGSDVLHLSDLSLTLFGDGSVRFDFGPANLQNFSYDLFTGTYLGLGDRLSTLVSGALLPNRSFLTVPEPAPAMLFALGLAGLVTLGSRVREAGVPGRASPRGPATSRTRHSSASAADPR